MTKELTIKVSVKHDKESGFYEAEAWFDGQLLPPFPSCRSRYEAAAVSYALTEVAVAAQRAVKHFQEAA